MVKTINQVDEVNNYLYNLFINDRLKMKQKATANQK